MYIHNLELFHFIHNIFFIYYYLNMSGPYALASTDFTGYNCQNALCPYGDNPLTLADDDEVQMITCRSLNGTFILEFRENRTLPIPWDASSSL